MFDWGRKTSTINNGKLGNIRVKKALKKWVSLQQIEKQKQNHCSVSSSFGVNINFYKGVDSGYETSVLHALIRSSNGAYSQSQTSNPPMHLCKVEGFLNEAEVR